MTFCESDEAGGDPALFDLPAEVRARYDELAETGDFRLPRLWYLDYRPASAPGSFHGLAATQVALVPPDARFARIAGRAKDVRRLADLRGLEVLDLREVTDAALAAVLALPGLRHLNLLGLSARSLDELAGHPGLEIVRCADAARLRDVRALATLRRLHTLWIDVSGPKDLAGLAGVTQLRNLLFTGSLTSLPTLQPLSGLTGLVHLYVGHVRIRDGSLRPLHGLRQLRSLELPEAFTLEELAELSVALPHTAGIHRAAFYVTNAARQFGRCKRCGSNDVVLTVGKPARALCRACDDAAIRRHALRWELAVADASARLGAAPPAPAAESAPEALTADPQARIPASRRGPPPAPPAESGEPWRTAEPELPPAWTHRILRRLKVIGGVGGLSAENFGALFQGGVCPACGMARGPRTAEPVRYRHSSGQEVHYDGWLVRDRLPGTLITLYSEKFIALLTDEERAVLEWRPAINTAYGRKTVFELAGARWHLPLATLRGGAPYDRACGVCGFAPPPRPARPAAAVLYRRRPARVREPGAAGGAVGAAARAPAKGAGAGDPGVGSGRGRAGPGGAVSASPVGGGHRARAAEAAAATAESPANPAGLLFRCVRFAPVHPDCVGGPGPRGRPSRRSSDDVERCGRAPRPSADRDVTKEPPHSF